jgi:GNAT superfamily N-acetyltransferase
MKTADILLRPVGPGDREFLGNVYACTRAAEMAMVPWTEEQKQAFVRMQFEAQERDYHARFPDAEYSIIVHEERDAGRLYLVRSGAGLHILDVTVLPEFRGCGIGRSVVTRLQQEAQQRPCPLTMYIEGFNPALALFERFGFRKASEDGLHVLLQWLPSTAPKCG